MFYITGIVLAFFLALLLLSKKNKTLADKILVCWLIVIGIHLLLFQLRYVADNLNYSFLLGIEIPFPLLHGPFLYLYTSAMTNQLPANKKLGLLHFIVPLLSLLMFSSFFLMPAEQKVEIFKQKGAGYEIPIKINLAAIYLSGIFYVCWCSILLKKHKKNIADEFSNTDKINLNWLRYLVYGIGVIWIVVLFGHDDLIFFSVVLFVLLLGFFGIKQVGIFSQINHVNTFQKEIVERDARLFIQEEQIDPSDENIATKKKYAKSGLNEEQAIQLQKQLTKLMEKEKIFTDSDLTLSYLASRLDIHPNYLSQVINEKEQSNFYDYINTLRIEEFKKLAVLPENKKYTILTLAFECGFNSKSSFNRYFKKITGTSPSEYMRSL